MKRLTLAVSAVLTAALLLAGTMAWAEEEAQTSSQLTSNVLQQITKNQDHYPSAKKVKLTAMAYHGRLDALAKKLLKNFQPDYGPVHSIWYDGEGTFVVLHSPLQHILHGEVYGPGTVAYVPRHRITGLSSYGTDGVHPPTRGQIYIEVPDLPLESQGMTPEQLMAVARAHVPQNMFLVAGTDKFPNYSLAEARKFIRHRLFPLYHKLGESVHSVWYKDGYVLVVSIKYGKHWKGRFFGSKAGEISTETSVVYWNEGDRMLEVAASIVPDHMTLLYLSGD